MEIHSNAKNAKLFSINILRFYQINNLPSKKILWECKLSSSPINHFGCVNFALILTSYPFNLNKFQRQMISFICFKVSMKSLQLKMILLLFSALILLEVWTQPQKFKVKWILSLDWVKKKLLCLNLLCNLETKPNLISYLETKIKIKRLFQENNVFWVLSNLIFKN